MTSPCTARKSSPCSPQLEKTLAQYQRPSAANNKQMIIIFKDKKKGKWSFHTRWLLKKQKWMKKLTDGWGKLKKNSHTRKEAPSEVQEAARSFQPWVIATQMHNTDALIQPVITLLCPGRTWRGRRVWDSWILPSFNRKAEANDYNRYSKS